MKNIILLTTFLTLCFLGYSENRQLSDFLFESQDFLFLKKSHDTFLKDRAKFWIKSSTQNSQYSHRSGEALIFINYLGKRKTRVTKLVRGRPAKLKSVVISGDKMESIYLCEINLAPGFFSPSGIKNFHCHFMTPQTCEAMRKTDDKAQGFIPVYDFMKSLMDTLPAEKQAFMDVYIPSYRFLLKTEKVSESDLEIKEYRDNYRSLCMGLRVQIGAKVRFKYDQDAEYEERVCLDHPSNLVSNKVFEMSHKKYCEYFINN